MFLIFYPELGIALSQKQRYIGQLGSKYLQHYGFTTVWVNGFGGLSLQPNKYNIVYYRKMQPRF